MAKSKKPVAKKPEELRQPTAWDPLLVERQSDELYFMQRFLDLEPVPNVNKAGKNQVQKASREEVTGLLQELESAIIERRIGKKSVYASQIRMLQRKLSSLLHRMGAKVEIEISRQTRKLLKELISLEAVRLSVVLLKEYASFHGQPVTKIRKQINLLRSELLTAIRYRKIKTDDPFYGDIKNRVIPSLNYYTEGRGKKEKIFLARNAVLHGYKDIGHEWADY